MHIALLDSGIGGLTLLNELVRRFPSAHYTYFADTYSHPYGTLGKEYLGTRINEIVLLLLERGADVVVLACNTASSVALKPLKEVTSVPIFGVEPLACPLKEKTLIMCTPLTARSAKVVAYQEAGARIYANGCLASLVERYVNDVSPLREYLEKELALYVGVERVVLGCTHYVFLEGEIKELLGTKTSNSFEPILNGVASLYRTDEPYKLDFIFSGRRTEAEYRQILSLLQKKC